MELTKVGYNVVAVDVTVLILSACDTVAVLKLIPVLVTDVTLPLASTANTGTVVADP